MTLRVALLTWGYPPVPTGIARAAEAIAEGLATRGCDVTVVSADRPAGTAAQVGGVRLVGCAPAGGLSWLRRRAAAGHLASPLAFRRAVLAEAARAPFDVVETTNWYAPAALLPRTAPLVVRLSTPAVKTTAAQTLRDRLDLAAAHRLERRLVARADALAFNTAASEAVLRSLYRIPADTTTAVIGLALADDLIVAGAAAPWPSAPVLAFIGRNEPRKGFVETIGAFAQLHAGQPEARLHIVGTDPGDEVAALAQLGRPAAVAAAIINHGRADDAAVRQILGATRVVAAPSRSESYGIVYREAAAFGRPLIAAREDASAREFVDATGAGVLADAVSSEAIARAVRRVLDDDALAERLRHAGLAHAHTLRREMLADATLALYARAGARQRAHGSAKVACASP